MDLSEATDVLGAMVDQYATGEESEAAGIVFAELDATRARVAELAAENERLRTDRQILSDRTARKDIELDELRAVVRADR